ncbi:MAG TPA: ABC transporter ATP-binding protein [Ktedonobacterales bacterium]|nr:ABC transporter ATP-binding protein [Ktedonobacterales bacterium]
MALGQRQSVEGDRVDNPDHAEPAIEIDRLVVRYGRKTAVDDLSLRVSRGSVFGLLGANGAGKTSTIKTLLGFRRPTSGGARIVGEDIVRGRIAINARIGYVSETNTLYLGMTIPQLCAFYRATSRRWNQEIVERYLRLFSLPPRARVRALSKGMRTQLALSLALGNDPDVLILDEPTTGLDPIARRAFLDVLMGDAAAAGKTIFFSSHVLADVESVVDSIAILRAGKLMVSGELDALKQRHGQVRLSYSEPPSDEALAAMRRVPGVGLVEREGRSVRVRVHGEVTEVVNQLRTIASPTTVDTTSLSLDDIFLFYAQEVQA